jgi:hypothetical protein
MKAWALRLPGAFVGRLDDLGLGAGDQVFGVVALAQRTHQFDQAAVGQRSGVALARGEPGCGGEFLHGI